MKISAPPSALEPLLAPAQVEPVTEPPGPVDANSDVGQTVRVQDLPLPASIQAFRAGARSGLRARGPLEDGTSDAEPMPAASRAGRGGTREGAASHDAAQATAVAPPPPAPARPSGYTGEAPVDQRWLQQRERYVQALRIDFDSQRSVAMANPGGPGWIDAPSMSDESGISYAAAGDAPTATAPNGRTVVFDEAAWRTHYADTLDARGVLVATALANLYGASAMNGLDADVRAQLVDLIAGPHAINAGPAPAGRAMGDAAQLAQVDRYLAQPQIRELIDLYGGAPRAATSDLAREQVRLYGRERFEQMGRLEHAMAHVREQYRHAFEQAQAAGQGPGWIERTATVATTDESGIPGPDVTTTHRTFDADAFTAWYGAQGGAANRAFHDVYGASQSTTSTEEIGGESSSQTITHTSTTFANSRWVAEDGVMRLRDGAAQININDPPRLHDTRQIYFDAQAGWITPQTNVEQRRSFFDRVTDALASPPWGSGTLMPPGLTPPDPLGRALLGSMQEQLQFPGQHLQTLLTNAALPLEGLLDGGLRGGLRGSWDALRGAGEDGLAHLINQGARGLVGVVNVWDALRGEYHERRLSADEISGLRQLYGDSIDYAAVRIRYGGTLEGRAQTDAFVVDNTIWFDQTMIDGDGNLNAKGLDLLNHEMCHVWQYQNRGPSYLGEALWSQLVMGRAAHTDGQHQGLGTAYDWFTPASAGKGFDDMNPEQQAELAGYVARSLNGNGALDEQALRAMLVAELRNNGRAIGPTDPQMDRAVAVAREALQALRQPHGRGG